jgi:hypothetical protein
MVPPPAPPTNFSDSLVELLTAASPPDCDVMFTSLFN